MHRTVALTLLLLAALTGRDALMAAEIMTPLERVASTPKGQLKSPYPDFAKIADDGHRKYMAAGCNGCHGGGGGGGMAAPLTNPIWIYGDDDDTLFRLIALGTGKLSPGDAFGKLGYRRRGSEAVVGPMPHFGDVIKTDDDLWKIIAWRFQRTSLNATCAPVTYKPVRPLPTSHGAYGTPSIKAVPAVGRTSPRIIRSVVVLPAPFGPTKPVSVPGCTSKLRSSTATTRPNRLTRPWTEICRTSSPRRVWSPR